MAGRLLDGVTRLGGADRGQTGDLTTCAPAWLKSHSCGETVWAVSACRLPRPPNLSNYSCMVAERSV